ncbi:hypothetical protein A6R79_05020 [Xanthomonas translucens pv. translucens]|nr:hypothetical protein A6R79_05020 [Xanthomonas translucens pv. translucens]
MDLSPFQIQFLQFSHVVYVGRQIPHARVFEVQPLKTGHIRHAVGNARQAAPAHAQGFESGQSLHSTMADVYQQGWKRFELLASYDFQRLQLAKIAKRMRQTLHRVVDEAQFAKVAHASNGVR